MAVSGAGSLVFGRMFDRAGLGVLIPLTLLSALFAPLVFLGGFWSGLAGSALWGLGMGVHESIVPAAVATMVPVQRRPSAYGIFTAGYGLAWFLGSAVMGVLYDRSVPAVVIFCVVLELAAIPIFVKVKNGMRARHVG
jgi:predicted MFS family arabinose efflux permease